MSIVSASELNETNEVIQGDMDNFDSISEYNESNLNSINQNDVVSSSINVKGNSFENIRESVKNSKNGDVIYLSGVYNGDGKSISINTKNLVIKSKSSSSKAVLDAKNDNSRIFLINATNVRLENLIFKNMNSEKWGAVCVLKSHFTIVNCEFINNKGRVGGIFIDDDSPHATIKNCQFNNNKAIYITTTGGTYGGAIDSHSSYTIIGDCTFINNYAENSGGAIYFTIGDNNQVKNCNFKENRAENGGAISISSTAKASIIHSIFNDNKATQSGGCIYNNGKLLIEKSEFKNDNAPQAGTIQNYNELEIKTTTFTQTTNTNSETIFNTKFLTITDSQFNKCIAKNGGAIYNTGETTISNTNFTQNKANNGGSIYNTNKLTIKKVIFQKNNADNGGAIYNTGNITISQSKFNNNNADNGGSIYNKGNLIITNNEFNFNIATNGGSIYNNNIIKITGCFFACENASYGGNIYNNGEIEIENTNFEKNTATADAGNIYNNHYIILKNTLFKNNNAKNGGNIYNKNILIIDQSQLNTNTANHGGSIYNMGVLTITNTQFQRNSAINGGAIYTTNDATITNAKFIKNHANYGGSIFNTQILSIQKSRFEQNSAKKGSAIYNKGTLKISSSKFSNNQAQSFKLKSKNYKVVKGKEIIIKIYLKYGDNYLGIFTTIKKLTIDDKKPELSSGAPKQLIKLTINGKTYKKYTNNKGQVYFKLKTHLFKTKKYKFKINHPQSKITTSIKNNNYSLKIIKKTLVNSTKKALYKKNKQNTLNFKYQKYLKKLMGSKHVKTKKLNKNFKFKNKQDFFKWLKKTFGKSWNQVKKSSNGFWKFWNSRAFSLNPNYAKTLKKWGKFGDFVCFMLDFGLGIDEKGNMSWGDLIVNLISLIPGGAFLRAAKSGYKLLKYLPKLIKAFSKIIHTKHYRLLLKVSIHLINFLNIVVDLVTDVNKGIADIGLLIVDGFTKRKLNQKIINKILNNKHVKKITNNEIFKQISNNMYIKKIGKGILNFMGYPVKSLKKIIDTIVDPKKAKNNLKKYYNSYNKRFTQNIRSINNSKRKMKKNIKKYYNQKITKYKKLRKIIKKPRNLIYNHKYKPSTLKTPRKHSSPHYTLGNIGVKLKKGFNQAKSHVNKFIRKFKIF